MKVFKISITAYLDTKGRKCNKSEAYHLGAKGRQSLRPGYQKVISKSINWYGKYRDSEGRLRRVPLCPDKKASQEILAKLVADGAKGRNGLGNIYEKHLLVPVATHLIDFESDMAIKGGTEAHRRQVLSRLRKGFKACGFERLDDLDGGRFGEWLASRRQKVKRRIPENMIQEWYTVREAAAILDAKPPAVRALIHRHKLEAVGNGRARRYPRATIEAILDRVSCGISVQTSNYYIIHAKAFGRFLVKNRRLQENPFAHVQQGRTEVDRRHDRRELTLEELTRLLTATKTSSRMFRGLSGVDRMMLYATAASTGLRAAALASLTPGSFQLDWDPPVVILAAKFNKNRKPQVQPLLKEVIEILRDYLSGKPQASPMWGGTWARDHRGAEMIRKDLEEANIPYIVEGPDGPLHADFHALRHTFITLLRNVDLRTTQKLAGHSSPMQTARYSHRNLEDLAKAVQNLPNFLPKGGEK
jgi:excisionase family DNA binding protein